jgi:competence protein ComEC
VKELVLLKKPIFWLMAALALVWVAIFQLPSRELHLIFCDVGQGDAILATFGDTQVLIDGGPNNKVLDCLSHNLPFWDRKIEAIVLTHPDADHLTGLIDVIKRYSVSQFVVNSIMVDSSGFREFREAVLEEGTKIYSPQAGDKIRVGPMGFAVLWPKKKLGNASIWQDQKLAENDNLANADILGSATYSGETNDTSIVLKLSYGDFDALLTGDISTKVDEQLDVSPVEVLKVPHHGSKYSTSEGLLEKLKPSLAIISVGKNSFGHPTSETLERLRARDIKILRTDQAGTIEIISDGKNWGVR